MINSMRQNSCEPRWLQRGVSTRKSKRQKRKPKAARHVNCLRALDESTRPPSIKCRDQVRLHCDEAAQPTCPHLPHLPEADDSSVRGRYRPACASVAETLLLRVPHGRLRLCFPPHGLPNRPVLSECWLSKADSVRCVDSSMEAEDEICVWRPATWTV